MAKQQHVVAVPLPCQGHLNPLMRFSKVLASQGILVTFVNIDAVHYRIKELNQEEEEEEEEAKLQHGDDTPDFLQETHAADNIKRAHITIQGLDLASDFRISFQAFLEALVNNTAPSLEALIHELNRQGPPVTCLISDFYMTLPTRNVAHNLNIPRVVLFTSSASMLLLFHYVTQGERISTAKVLESLTRRAEREVICEGLAGLPTIYNNELPYTKHVVDETVFAWEITTKAFSESLEHSLAMAINSFKDLEAPAFMALSKHLSLPIYGVGPLVEPLHKDTSTSLWKEDEACIRWLDRQPPLSVLYISFGSITLLSQSQFEEIVAALVSSQQRFLWVLRPDLVKDIEYSSTLVSDADVLSRCHGNGYVVDWAPQLQVLSHPSVGGFLTHCGWNSIMEAIAHGVPMLCWPYIADQFLDAKFVVEDWKVGLQFEASSSKEGACLVESHEIERVIKALMQGEEGTMLRKNAMCLKEAGSQSLLPGGTSHKNIQSLIRSFV